MSETILIPEISVRRWDVLPDSPPIKVVLHDTYLEIFSAPLIDDDEVDDDDTGIKTREKRTYYNHSTVPKSHISNIATDYDHRRQAYSTQLNFGSNYFRHFFQTKKEAEEIHKKYADWLIAK